MRRNGRPNPFSVGIFGALIGLLTGATVVYFSDRKNRVRVRRAIGDLETQAKAKLNEFSGILEDANTTSRKRMATNLRSMAKQLDAPKK